MKKVRSWLILRLETAVAWLEKRGTPWHKLPLWLAIISLYAIRTRLRRKNLHSPPPSKKRVSPVNEKEKFWRSIDGSYNSLEKPEMGSAGTCFGRNMKGISTNYDDPQVLIPNPREVSRKILARKEFIPAKSLNMLAAAWIQFQVHGWFRHVNDGTKQILIPIQDDDSWPYQRPMPVNITKQADPSHTEDGVPVFVNELDHWWDGSQIYGYDAQTVKELRSFIDGKLKVTKEGLLPVDERDGIDKTGMRDNWWIGLSLMHTIFALEHNAICDRLKSAYPSWSDEELFQKGRLINAALMAKIQTLEWTTAILNNPVLKVAMNVNWGGLRKQGYTLLSKILKERAVAEGIMGSDTEFAGVDYHLTEEFVSVYRLHPLLPDEMTFYSIKDHSRLGTFPMEDMIGPKARAKIQNRFSMTDLFYTFGTSNPGAITLHNYPKFLRSLFPQRFHPDDPYSPHFDLAAVELVRDRARGIPRYNAFREQLHMPRVETFEDLTGDPKLAQELSEIYADMDQLDLMVGLFAEKKPPGFGFSDTAFRIFVLMATRRLECDRFFTTDYNDRVYTPDGLEWVEKNSMVTVLLRHYPDLLPYLHHAENAFIPWKSNL